MKLRMKMICMIVSCTIIAVLLVGAMAIVNSLQVAEDGAKQELLTRSENLAKDMDVSLTSIETAVNTLAAATTAEVRDLERFKRDKQYVEQCTNNMKSLGLNCALNVKGAMTYYIRYNPDFTDPVSGFFGGRNSAKDKFAYIPCTDFSIYPKDDMAHVGWYYIPVNNGKPTWMNPYLNANINVYMISYVVPLFAKDGTSLGIAGMDVDFAVIKDKVAAIKLHDTGFAMLVNSENQILASRDGISSQQLQEISSKLDKYVGKSNPQEMVEYESKGVTYLAAYAVLQNGMKYVVTVPKDEITAGSRRLVRTIVLVMALIILLGIGGAYFFSGKMVAPLQKLETKTRMMAAGDLTVKVDIETDDEIGGVACAFNDMAEHMSEVIGKITLAADQVAGGAQNIADSGNALASGAATQASSVEELSASIAEINAQTAQTARNAEEANVLTVKAKQLAQSGNEQMDELVGAINDISVSSKNISKIIRAIDEIAFQTNILALNASVEAARAGQHGKGFAVVAEEVGNLAARSAKAARETSEIIEGSLSKVEAGTKLAGETAQALQEIQTGVVKVADFVDEIASASAKQSSALDMLNKGVMQVSNVVQNNSSTAEESAAASEQLSAQASVLQETVSSFKIS